MGPHLQADSRAVCNCRYDNPKSLRLKVAMAKSLGVKSFGMWTADKLNYSSPDWMEWWDALS